MPLVEHHDDLHGRAAYVALYHLSTHWTKPVVLLAAAGFVVLPTWITTLASVLLGIALAPLPGRHPLKDPWRPVGRYLLRDLWRAGPVRRAWTSAVIDSGAVDPPKDRSRKRRSHIGPRPGLRVHRTPLGDTFTVTHATGYSTITDEIRDTMASLLRVEEVRLHVDRKNRSRAHVTIVRQDPFADHPPFPWPLRDTTETSVWDPLPFAVDENHQPVPVLIAGVTGSGKSVAVNLIVAQAALDPTAELTIIDGGGGVDYVRWAASTHTLVDDDISRAAAALERIQTIMRERKANLIAADAVKVQRGETTHHVIIDEGSYFFNHPAKDQAQRFTAALLDLVQRGRKYGVRVVLAMQRPAGSLVNTDVRAQFGYRIAFRTADRETSRMVFPEGDAPAHEISRDRHAGVAYLRAEDGDVQMVRAYMLTEQETHELTDRASSLRIDATRPTIHATPIASLPPLLRAAGQDDTADHVEQNLQPDGDPVSGPAHSDGMYVQEWTDGINRYDANDPTTWDLETTAPDGPPPPTPPTPKAAQPPQGPDRTPLADGTGTSGRASGRTKPVTLQDVDPDVWDALRRDLAKHPDSQRDQINGRLGRTAPGWHLVLRELVERGEVTVTRLRRPGRPGQPPKLYRLAGTDTG
jgi:hypothetical protein